jgi:hypothetical protein
LSGAQQVDRTQFEPGETLFRMKRIDGLFKPDRPQPATYPSIQYHIDRDITDSKREVTARIMFQDRQSDFKIEQVAAIFGPRWESFMPAPRPGNWPQGINVIRYLFQDRESRRQISIMFGPHGGVSTCLIFEAGI